MNFKQKLLTAGITAGLTIAASGANASVIIFDGNKGGTAKSGTVETGVGSGTNGGGDSWGQTLSFNDFAVTTGTSNHNIAASNFNTANVTYTSTTKGVYQDISPEHGGLGAFTLGGAEDTDNLDSNLGSGVARDEILFFNFDMDVILDTVWFNGSHTENTDFIDGNGQAGDTKFNIFTSVNGIDYASIFPSNTQQSPYPNDWINTSLTSGYQFYAIAATGYEPAGGGYVEAIEYTAVSAPQNIALFGLGLIGLGLSRRKSSKA